MEPTLRIIFGTGIYEEVLFYDLDEIKSACLDKMKLTDSRSFSNKGGWQSTDIENDIFFQTSPIVSHIIRSANHLAQSMGLVNLELCNMWININGKNHSNVMHTHPNCTLSGCFYVKVPKDSGKIVFYHPAASLMERDWEFKRTEWNLQNSEAYAIEPEENLLLLFPSWIQHSVEPNLNDETRISISFNFR